MNQSARRNDQIKLQNNKKIYTKNTHTKPKKKRVVWRTNKHAEITNKSARAALANVSLQRSRRKIKGILQLIFISRTFLITFVWLIHFQSQNACTFHLVRSIFTLDQHTHTQAYNKSRLLSRGELPQQHNIIESFFFSRKQN